MPFTIRRSQDRGYFDYGWLKTFHTFSFDQYHDPKFMGFRSLRVINEDRVEPHHGFPLHGHKDMEIMTIVIEGELTHQDSMGNTSLISPGEVQLMSAGTGILHSEFNLSLSKLVHLLQIWIHPDEMSLTPQYQQKKFVLEPNAWTLIASKQSKKGSLHIHQDAEIFLASLDEGTQLDRDLHANRYGWLQVIAGNLKWDDSSLQQGDGASIEPGTHISLKTSSPAKVLFFDLN